MLRAVETTYFDWLCAKVMDEDHQDYYSLLQVLYETEFVWVVPADEHRAEDGEGLRQDFQREKGIRQDTSLESLPSSVLEVLISFSLRAEFQTDFPAKDWFWIFVDNLSLSQFTHLTSLNRQRVDEILHNFIWRVYEPNGRGGLFPMHRTQNDQRNIEIWYQFCEYLEDHGLF